MHEQIGSYPQPPLTPRQQSKPVPGWLIGLLVLVVFGALAICAGIAQMQMSGNKTRPTVTSSGYAGPGGPAAPSTTKADKATPTAPTNVFDEGDWVVGTDIQAGTYRTEAPVESQCYWGIYKAGTNKADIIQNDFVTGGRPSVTLKPGQEFSSTGCGTWVRTA